MRDGTLGDLPPVRHDNLLLIRIIRRIELYMFLFRPWRGPQCVCRLRYDTPCTCISTLLLHDVSASSRPNGSIKSLVNTASEVAVYGVYGVVTLQGVDDRSSKGIQVGECVDGEE